MKNKKGFTLLELLIVVVIIGILAAIALPQYKRAVLKANLSKGIPLVKSLYDNQQAYHLTHGAYAWDIDSLDVESPNGESCVKWSVTTASGWDCPWGGVEIAVDIVDFQYPVSNSAFNSKAIILYGYLLDKDVAYNGRFKDANSVRFCLAKPNSKIAQDVCEDVGGVLVSENTTWKYYSIH